MSSQKIEFQGKDVADAIKNACKGLNASQGELDIEVLNTGSRGIFGLGRQKVRLRVSRKKQTDPDTATPFEAAINEDAGKSAKKKSDSLRKKQQEKTDKLSEKPEPEVSQTDKPAPDAVARQKSEPHKKSEPRPEQPTVEISPETLENIKNEVDRLLELMGYQSEVTIRLDNNTIVAHIDGDHVEDIIGPEGRVLDGLQYLVRKIISKRYQEKLIISLDAGDFRANRLKDLAELGKKLADEVRADGKTKAIPSLNPSERRVVHMALHGDKDIRSRSVGDGLFKKVLIFRPGKGKRGSRKRRSNRGSGSAKKD